MKPFFLASLFSFFLDRISKYLLMRLDYEVLEILPFLSLVKTWNRGVAFGFLNKEENINLILLLINTLLLSLLFLYARKTDKFNKIALGLIFGGGLGNLTDRLLFGAVFDFIDLHYRWFHWPAFNLADLFITLGLFLFLIRYVVKN